MCLAQADGTPACPACGAGLDETAHRTLFAVRYTLSQIAQWERDGRVLPREAEALRRDYLTRRDELVRELKPAPSEAEGPPPEVVDVADDAIVEVVEKPAEAPPAAPPPKEVEWRGLLTERNIRWILNLGIFIFSVALAVFIHSQWTGMPPGAKTAMLFGATGAALVAGHFLRGTMLRQTGTALVVLGAIALPIDFLGAVQFKLIAASNGLGLAASAACVAMYLAGARLYRSPAFAWLTVAAASSLAAFGLATAGVAWRHVPAWTTPFLVAAVAVSARLPEAFRMPAWFAGLGLTYAGAAIALSFSALGFARGAAPVEIALASCLAVAAVVRRPAARWVAAAAFGLMLAVLLADLRLEARANAMIAGAFGSLLLLAGRRRKALPFTIVAGIVSLAAAGHAAYVRDWSALAVVLLANGAAAFVLRAGHLPFVLVGLGLAAGANGLDMRLEMQPLVYAGYGALLGLGASKWFRAAATHAAILAAGAAMFLVAVLCLRYYDERQLLGVAACAMSAAAFGAAAWRMRSRLVADLAYGSLGFAYVYALRFFHMPGAWLGVAVALFAFAMFALQERLKLLRPTLFTGTAAAIGCLALASVQWLVARKYAPAGATLALVASFFLAVGWRTTHRWVLHAGTYLAVAAVLCACDGLRWDYAMRVTAVFPLAAAALIVAQRKGERHLGLAGVSVLLCDLAFAFANEAMYAKPELRTLIGLAAATGGLGAFFSFARPGRVDLRAPSAVMGVGIAGAYILFLKWMSTGSRWGGMWVFAMAVLLACAAWLLRADARRAVPLLWVAAGVAALAGAVGWVHPNICAAALGCAFALFFAVALWRRAPAWVVVATLFAAVGEFRLLLEHWGEPHVGLWLLPAAAVLLLMTIEVRRRLGEPFAHGLLALTLGTAAVATAAGMGRPADRIVLLLADTAIFALLALTYRRPAFLYAASVSLTALDVAVMSRFGLPPRAMAVQLLTLSLVQVVCSRAAGERYRPYGTPLFLTGLVVAAGVLLFGVWEHRAFTTTQITWAIWGLMLAALVYGVAGRLRGIPWLLFVGAGHLLGAYYLTLHKYRIDTVEFYTVPVAAAIVAWSMTVGRGKDWRRALEAVGVAAAFLPSAILSVSAPGRGHMVAAFALAVALVLAGMVLRRRVLVIGGTGAFVLEVLAKAVEFLVRADLSLAQWGMLLGGLLIAMAALFESRKIKFVRERAAEWKARAAERLARWE